MNNRMENWLKRPQQEAQAIAEIVADKAVSAYLYRTAEQDDEAVGFDIERIDKTRLRTITIRIDYPKSFQDSSEGANYDMLGLTEETDIQKNDVLFITTQDGQLAKMFVQRADVRQRGCEVRLRYE